jgi:hypothetical protein
MPCVYYVNFFRIMTKRYDTLSFATPLYSIMLLPVLVSGTPIDIVLPVYLDGESMSIRA